MPGPGDVRFSVEVGRERQHVGRDDRLVVEQQRRSLALTRVVIRERHDSAVVHDGAFVREEAHFDVVGHVARRRRSHQRHRPLGPASAEASSQGGSLDVLVVGPPHEHDEARRLSCEELSGSRHHRRSVDPWI